MPRATIPHTIGPRDFSASKGRTRTTTQNQSRFSHWRTPECGVATRASRAAIMGRVTYAEKLPPISRRCDGSRRSYC